MELNPLKIPVSSLAAPAAAIIFCAFLALSVQRFPPGFTPFDNWISDLGNTNLNPEGAMIFNTGCMIAGVLLAIFFFGLYKWYTNELWRNLFVAVAQVAGIASGISLTMVGYYPELFANEHYMWATAFFVSLFLALLLVNAGLFTHWKYSKWVAYTGLTATGVIMVFIAAEMTSSYAPVVEWIAVALALVWSVAMALEMYVTFA